MADALKILGQRTGEAAENVLYTVPENTQTTISSIVICNRESSDNTYRIAIRENGGGKADATDTVTVAVTVDQWIAYDTKVWANTTSQICAGITLNDNDDIVVYSSDANVSFSCYGVETTQD